MTTLYLGIGLSYIAIGFLLAVLYYYVFRRDFVGNFWGATAVGVIGAFLGGVADYLLGPLIEQLQSINGVLNVFPPLIVAYLLLSAYARLSEKKDLYD